MLDSKIEVVGSDDADGKCCSSKKDQDMEDFGGKRVKLHQQWKRRIEL